VALASGPGTADDHRRAQAEDHGEKGLMKWLINSERAPSRDHVARLRKKSEGGGRRKGGYHLAGRTAMISEVRSIRSG
jgi:hypothetical protein